MRQSSMPWCVNGYQERRPTSGPRAVHDANSVSVLPSASHWRIPSTIEKESAAAQPRKGQKVRPTAFLDAREHRLQLTLSLRIIVGRLLAPYGYISCRTRR